MEVDMLTIDNEIPKYQDDTFMCCKMVAIKPDF